MRDILITLIIFGSIPFILRKPYIGALMWVWISVMNPHTLAWGFAVNFPFAAIIAGVTMVSLILNKVPKSIPLTPIVLIFMAFVFWMNVTTIFALYPDLVYDQWNKVMKIMLMSFVTLMLIKTKRHVQLLIGVIVFSLSYYGVKGGIFTLLGGGEHLVWGPGNSFIAGNNELALALIMTIPLLHYLQVVAKNKWVHYGLLATMLLCAVASLGTYSRGALLALAAMGGSLWIKSQKKFRLAILFILAVPLVIAYMPEQWNIRMDTITTYEADASVQGRFSAWEMAFNLAKDRPLVGGGFEITTPELFSRYAPNKGDVPRAAHSIYFQALGEHGFVGLGLYLLLGFLTWRTGAWIIRNTRGLHEYQWAFSLASMIQVSMIGFATGGAFLSLLYWDVPYYLMAAMVVTRIIVENELKEKAALTISAKSTRPSHQLGIPEPIRPITKDSG